MAKRKKAERRWDNLSPGRFDRIFQRLLRGEAPKQVGFDNGVSRNVIQKILERFPLFFGARRPYKKD